MNNHYNNLTNTDLTRTGMQNSINQSQMIKPNELLINDDMLNLTNKRHGFDETNKVISGLNDEILTLNNRISTILMNQNDYDKIKYENNDYQQQITDLKNNLNNNKIYIDNFKLEITKLKQLIYEKYNNEIISCNVILTKENNSENVEIIAHAKGHDFISSENEYIFERSLTNAVYKISNQIKKQHEKEIGR